MLKENEEKRAEGRKLVGTVLITAGIAVFLSDIPFIILLFILDGKQFFNNILIPNVIVILIGIIILLPGIYLHRKSKKTLPSDVN